MSETPNPVRPEWRVIKGAAGGGFKCLSCGADSTSVVDSRSTVGGQMRRTRVCDTCNARVSTIEIPLLTDPFEDYERRLFAAFEVSLDDALVRFERLRAAVNRNEGK